ncbi:MAG: AAA family ATPase [Solobacterium sp.]|nr:AAA family ATPase [Solobacterium sp.]
MYLSKLHIENFRLLKNVDMTFDRDLTLFVGKNNTGKTSVMEILFFLVSDRKNLSIDDYPLTARNELYGAIIDYWRDQDFLKYQKSVPVPKFTLTFDYSDGIIGNLDAFVIDLDEDVTVAIAEVTFDVPLGISGLLENLKSQFDAILPEEADDNQKSKCLAQVVRDNFDSLFVMNIAAVNPSALTDIKEVKKSELQNVFNLKVIKAERNMDESEMANSNPIGQIMKKLFDTELEDVETALQPSMQELHRIVTDASFSLNTQINSHMDMIVGSMMTFGYPSWEDLQLRANTNLSLQKRIIEDTQLTYVSNTNEESLPESHNGLGYKNLIKITMELHDYARSLKDDRTKLPLLFIEEPEAHMHPQLQTTFVSFLSGFLVKTVGENCVQVVMTSHSAHVANTVPFKQVRYILRRSSDVICRSMDDFPTSIELPQDAGLTETQRNRLIAKEKEKRLDFLQKYMKLSYCDLYFCDKAILVEGASERLLLPDMIRKSNDNGAFADVDIPLSSQYYTIIEVGGAYAHHFYDFVDYLGIPTLIITDIDFAKGTHNSACTRDEAEKSSNGAINRWCRKALGISDSTTVRIEQILGMNEEQHSLGCRHLEFQKEENGFHPRSLEDAIINCNRELFHVSEEETPNFDGTVEKKTDFALRLLVEDGYRSYQVPSYIRDGLVWLNKQTREGISREVCHDE